MAAEACTPLVPQANAIHADGRPLLRAVPAPPAAAADCDRVTAPASPLPQLQAHAAASGLAPLQARLAELQAWLADDLASVEDALRQPAGDHLAQRAGTHLLLAGGKRLRPLCTLIAGRIGPRQDAEARQHVRHLAVAVELVHAATLLHDDVVDVADTRRGQPTARQLHGNEVSIFAGDWMLVAALRRIVSAGHPELVTTALDTIEQMIFGEVEQVERAKQLADDIDGYYRVIDRKTAALFRWALQAGARASGCPAGVEAALVAFGHELGTAFQVIDDVLDLAGDPHATGKALFADLAEGKVTLPLALMLQQRPDLRPLLAELRTACQTQKDGGARIEDGRARIVMDAVRATGALEAAQAAALRHTQAAQAALGDMPDCAEVAALRAIAEALAARRA